MRVRLSSKKFIFAYIPVEGGQSLRAFSRVLIIVGSIPDLPGVHYIIIRGKLYLTFLGFLLQGRSKYGMKALFYSRKKDRRHGFLKYTQQKKQKHDSILQNFQKLPLNLIIKKKINFFFFLLEKLRKDKKQLHYDLFRKTIEIFSTLSTKK
jgi:hypothetical protein